MVFLFPGLQRLRHLRHLQRRSAQGTIDAQKIDRKIDLHPKKGSGRGGENFLALTQQQKGLSSSFWGVDSICPFDPPSSCHFVEKKKKRKTFPITSVRTCCCCVAGQPVQPVPAVPGPDGPAPFGPGDAGRGSLQRPGEVDLRAKRLHGKSIFTNGFC